MNNAIKKLLENTLHESILKETKIEIFGMGYVGLPLAIRLAYGGWDVTGIDINHDRITRLEQNDLYESELNLRTEFYESRKHQHLHFSTRPSKIEKSKIGIICVPTPLPTSGKDSDEYVKNAVKNFLESSKKGDVIIIESSIEVGTTDKLKKFIESGGFHIGKDFGLSFCPERIDPQNKKWNLENIPRIIYCSDDLTYAIAKKIYEDVNNSNILRVSSVKVAEVVKSFENSFRLVNISLVNELAILCDKLSINVNEVIEAASTKPFGFMPFHTGAGAGGHCIPKDPTFLVHSAKKIGYTFQTIENALKINKSMPKYVVASIEKTLSELNLKKSVVVCGLSYKPDIEDMRDSPGFKIVDELYKKGLEVVGYDPYFQESLLSKYLIENKMDYDFNFKFLKSLDSDILKNFECLCIVQHHKKIKFRIEEIYQNSEISLIYDCQNLLDIHPYSKTILKSLGR